MSKVYLVDGSAYIFRAFYAITRLSTSDGFPTNALFGFTRMLLKLLSEADSEHVVISFDTGRETFRNEMYAQYKANRGECPEELVPQMPYFREIAVALGLKLAELKGFEADDVIGTLAKRLSAAGYETVIVTGDKDLMQLVGDRITIWDTMKDVRYDAEGVKAKMGVPPEKVIEFLALTGDSSDNIPGLKGCGPKTALQLLEKYGNVESVIASAAAISEDKSLRNRKKIAEQIESDQELLRLSRRLAEINCNSPVELAVADAPMDISNMSDLDLFNATKREAPKAQLLQDLIARFEFQSLFKDLDLTPEPAACAQPIEVDYRTIYAEEFPDFCKQLSEQPSFAFDLETTALDVLHAKVVGAAFSWSENVSYYVPLGHAPDVDGAELQTSWGEFVECIAPLFANPELKKRGQNLKYDISVLLQNGLEVCGIEFDSMIASYLLHPDRGNHGLSALAVEYFRHKVIEYDEVLGGRDGFHHVPIPSAAVYAGQDAQLAWCLSQRMEKLLEEQGLLKVFREIEVPLIPVLSGMELAGIQLDCEMLRVMSEELAIRLAELEARLYDLAGCRFNINSPKQLQEILFQRLQIPTKGLKKTKTGISTDSSVLELLSAEHELPGVILEYRALHKLKSTYVDALPQQVSPVTGRLHTKFNQTVAGTGRLSSSEPNLQNIPVQNETGRRIRAAFTAGPGKVLISADYSQIELRVLAHMSGDKELIGAFAENLDIHTETARDILNIPGKTKVTAEQRRIGKTINFGVIYGMSGFRLGRDLGIPVGVANRYIEDYFAHYSGVRKYFDALEEEAEKQGYVCTLFGRRRNITALESRGRDRGFLRRAAVNAPIQGSAADIIKLAMVKIEAEIRRRALPLRMLLQIHDELLFECDEQVASTMAAFVKEAMENVFALRVPLSVEVGTGKNWHDAH